MHGKYINIVEVNRGVHICSWLCGSTWEVESEKRKADFNGDSGCFHLKSWHSILDFLHSGLIRELASRPDHLSCCEQPGLEEVRQKFLEYIDLFILLSYIYICLKFTSSIVSYYRASILFEVHTCLFK